MSTPLSNQTIPGNEAIPKEMYALISYIGEMKRNHMIMAARLDSLEKDIETLKGNQK